MKHFWFLLLVPVFLLGRELNRWQVRLHGEMPLSYPWGDWIPYKQYLLSIGGVMQLFGIVASILATLLRVCDERYMRRSM